MSRVNSDVSAHIQVMTQGKLNIFFIKDNPKNELEIFTYKNKWINYENYICFCKSIITDSLFFKVNIWLLFCFVMTISFSTNSFAIVPPERVYRTDSRAPQMIFQNGFTSWGQNRDLLRHVIGDSSRDRTDGLISTSGNWDSARQITTDLLLAREVGSIFYIYSIRPSQSFYDVNGSLIRNNMINSNNDLGPQSLYVYTTFSWQEEFASEYSIPRENIEYAQEARLT